MRVTDREDLEFVGEFDERLEEDASSNAGNGEKEDGMVSCGGCARPCGRPAGEGDVLYDKFRIFLKIEGVRTKEGRTDALVDGLGVDEMVEGGVGDLRGVGAAGDFLRKLKRGSLRLALDEASGVEEEGTAEECWRPRNRSESSEVLVRSLAEAETVGVREEVAISAAGGGKGHAGQELEGEVGMYMRSVGQAPLFWAFRTFYIYGYGYGLTAVLLRVKVSFAINVLVCHCLFRK